MKDYLALCNLTFQVDLFDCETQQQQKERQQQQKQNSHKVCNGQC